jgi:hypothetical protein
MLEGKLKDEIGKTCSTHGRYEKYEVLLRKPKTKSPLERL